MARGIAVRSITTHPDGRVEVAFAAGSPTAPAGQTGSVIYTNQKHIEDSIKEFEASLTDPQLVLLLLAARWLQPNGTFGNVNQVTNVEMRLDLFFSQPLRFV